MSTEEYWPGTPVAAPGKRQLLTTRTETSKHLADVRGSLDHFILLDIAELSENNSGKLEVVKAVRPVPFRDHSGAV